MHTRYDVDLLALTTWQMLWGGIPIIALMLIVPERPVDFTPETAGAFICLLLNRRRRL
jgi:hypothetical protein